jgi:two-component sensor histidine kinase
MVLNNTDRTVEKLLRQQAALAAFGTFAFGEMDLQKILMEAARICAASLGVPFCKICRYRPIENDLLIEAGCGWDAGVVGRVISQANESSPQGRAYITGKPVIIRNIQEANDLSLPAFYPQHNILSTVDVVIPGIDGAAYGVLEVDSPIQHLYDVHDINFLTGFANVLAQAVATSIKNRALKALIDEKNLLAEELQHRVRNNLQMVAAMLSTYGKTSTEDPGRQGIAPIVRRVMALAKVYDSLLGVGLSQTVDLGHYLGELCKSLPELQDDRAHSVELIYNEAVVPMNLDAITSIGMVVAELVTNSYGHAFPDRTGTVIVTLASPDHTRLAMVTIKDDGVGFIPEISSKRRGLGLAKRLMEQIGGSLDMSSAAGTQWTLRFPVPLTGRRRDLAA